MTCQECEIKLGMGEDADEHLASCNECRLLARELRLNSYAMREMRVRPRMYWALATAAAAIAVAIGVWRLRPAPRQPTIMAAHGAAPQLQQHREQTVVSVSKRRKKKTTPPAETLRVKMFTSDPDVVIYWIVDKKEGFE
jgi:hypothetical protein